MISHQRLELRRAVAAHERDEVELAPPRVRQRRVDRREDGHGVGVVGRERDDEVVRAAQGRLALDARRRPRGRDRVVHRLLRRPLRAHVAPLHHALLLEVLDLLLLRRLAHVAALDAGEEEQEGGEVRARHRRTSMQRRGAGVACGGGRRARAAGYVRASGAGTAARAQCTWLESILFTLAMRVASSRGRRRQQVCVADCHMTAPGQVCLRGLAYVRLRAGRTLVDAPRGASNHKKTRT